MKTLGKAMIIYIYKRLAVSQEQEEQRLTHFQTKEQMLVVQLVLIRWDENKSDKIIPFLTSHLKNLKAKYKVLLFHERTFSQHEYLNIDWFEN